MDLAALAELVGAMDAARRAEMFTDLSGGFDAHLGLRFTWVAPDRVVAILDPGPQHTQPYGLVHGGVYCTMAEAVCSVGAALGALQAGEHAVGVENHTAFLRAARPGARLTITARPGEVVGPRHTWHAEVTAPDGTVCATSAVVVRRLPAGTHIAGQDVSLQRALPEDDPQ